MARIPIPPGTDGIELRLVRRGSEVEDYPQLSKDARSGLLGEAYGQKNRGRSQVLETASANPVDLISAVGDDQLSRQLTLTCQVTPKQLEGVDFPPVRGRVEWGNDGFQAQADFDFCHGVQLSLTGAFLRLSAAVDTDAPGVIIGQAIPALKVGAHLSYEPPTVAGARRTRYATLDAAGAGSIATFPIPRFAAHLDVPRENVGVAAGNVRVEFLDRTGAIVLTAITSTGPIFEEKIPNDARFARITNLGGAAMNARLVFTLYL